MKFNLTYNIIAPRQLIFVKLVYFV